MWGLQTTRESLNSTVNTSASWSEQARPEMMSVPAAFLMFTQQSRCWLGKLKKSTLYLFFRGTLLFLKKNTCPFMHMALCAPCSPACLTATKNSCQYNLTQVCDLPPLASLGSVLHSQTGAQPLSCLHSI